MSGVTLQDMSREYTGPPIQVVVFNDRTIVNNCHEDEMLTCTSYRIFERVLLWQHHQRRLRQPA